MRKSMKVKILCVLSIVLLASVLTACSLVMPGGVKKGREQGAARGNRKEKESGQDGESYEREIVNGNVYESR